MSKRDDAPSPVVSVALRGVMGGCTTAFAVGIGAGLTMLVVLRGTPPGPITWAILLGVPLVAATLALLWKSGARVQIGDDGLAIRNGLRRTFVPIEAVRAIDIVGGPQLADGDANEQSGLRVTRADGPPIHLPMIGAPEHVDVARRRILAALRAAKRRKKPAMAAFERGERSLPDWRERLGGLFDRATGFRDRPVDASDAEEVLDDATASHEQRLGAALALAASGEGGRDRIRIAAEASAAPRLRVALEKIGAGEADAAVIEAALEEDHAPPLEARRA